MPVSDDRKFTRDEIIDKLSKAKGKRLGEVDTSRQFDRAIYNPKITGIAGDVIEQSVLGYGRDNSQEYDIEIDGEPTEIKTTGVWIHESDKEKADQMPEIGRQKLYHAKEGISITAVTFDPTIEIDFNTSHFWRKSERLLIVFYEYLSPIAVPASEYSSFPIIDFRFNSFSKEEKEKMQNDWEIVRDHLQSVYESSENEEARNEKLIGFTHELRSKLLLIELVPSFKRKLSGAYQKPRYRLKQTFVDQIVHSHFCNKDDKSLTSLHEPFSSFAQLDARCHRYAEQYAGKTLGELKELLDVATEIQTKDFAARCILKMFDAECNRLNQISDFLKAGIIAKTITLSVSGHNTEDIKLQRINFEEWADKNIDFEESQIYVFFCEHSFLFPVFREYDSTDHSKTTFEGFKRMSFGEDFIRQYAKQTWDDSRELINNRKLKWVYALDKNGEQRRNSSGAFIGSPNFPKSSHYTVFLRGGSSNSSNENRTECVNGIRMLPQFFWVRGAYVSEKLRETPFI